MWRAAYVAPQVNAIQIGSEKFLTASNIGGDHSPANPDPDDVLESRRKIFEFDFTFEEPTDATSEDSRI